MRAKPSASERAKALYQELRRLSCEELWQQRIPQFDQANAKERSESVGLIRAVGVVFAETGSDSQKADIREWLLGLLGDPDERTRRYAMGALPKLGSGPREEQALLALLKTTTLDRERKFISQTLDKIGGAATLAELDALSDALQPQTEQKVRASVARTAEPSVIEFDRVLTEMRDVRIHLRGRKGLEDFVADETKTYRNHHKFRVLDVNPGMVSIAPTSAFSLGDLYAMRCFGTLGFVLGRIGRTSSSDEVEELAGIIASPLSRRLLRAFTRGSCRYRLNFVDKGAQRGAVRAVAVRAFELCPAILNDPRQAPWSIDVQPGARGGPFVELRPRFSPDPRLFYRTADVPAASHPPLAACMARLAGAHPGEIVWDPFCGSGLELVERSLLGGVQRVFGTDLSPEAIAIATANVSAANVTGVASTFVCSDFRDFANIDGLGPRSVTLIITNPPLGMRVPIPDVRGLVADLFRIAAKVLKPGGRLVFANPFRKEACPEQATLRLVHRKLVDFGGFACRLEKYIRDE